MCVRFTFCSSFGVLAFHICKLSKWRCVFQCISMCFRVFKYMRTLNNIRNQHFLGNLKKSKISGFGPVLESIGKWGAMRGMVENCAECFWNGHIRRKSRILMGYKSCEKVKTSGRTRLRLFLKLSKNSRGSVFHSGSI